MLRHVIQQDVFKRYRVDIEQIFRNIENEIHIIPYFKNKENLVIDYLLFNVPEVVRNMYDPPLEKKTMVWPSLGLDNKQRWKAHFRGNITEDGKKLFKEMVGFTANKKSPVLNVLAEMDERYDDMHNFLVVENVYDMFTVVFTIKDEIPKIEISYEKEDNKSLLKFALENLWTEAEIEKNSGLLGLY
jgi:hypothetical protein